MSDSCQELSAQYEELRLGERIGSLRRMLAIGAKLGPILDSVDDYLDVFAQLPGAPNNEARGQLIAPLCPLTGKLLDTFTMAELQELRDSLDVMESVTEEEAAAVKAEALTFGGGGLLGKLAKFMQYLPQIMEFISIFGSLFPKPTTPPAPAPAPGQ